MNDFDARFILSMVEMGVGPGDVCGSLACTPVDYLASQIVKHFTEMIDIIRLNGSTENRCVNYQGHHDNRNDVGVLVDALESKKLVQRIPYIVWREKLFESHTSLSPLRAMFSKSSFPLREGRTMKTQTNAPPANYLAFLEWVLCESQREKQKESTSREVLQ